MKATPYTTKSGLQIGCRYTPPSTQPEIYGHMLKLQTALLEKRKPTHWLVKLIWKWL